MDSTILAGIIGGLCTVGGSIVAVVITRALDNPWGLQKNKRLMALVGRWSGTVHQEAFGPKGNPLDHQLTIVLKLKNRTILGEGTLSFLFQNKNVIETITVIGGFVHDRFLKLEYTIETQPGSIQFGFVLLELSPNGQTLYGRFVGYGSLFTVNMVAGTVKLLKGVTSHSSSSLPATV